MTETLNRWIATADAVRHMDHFRIAQVPLAMGFVRSRVDDYYISLVGDLFDRMRVNQAESAEWARLGNAFARFAEDEAGILTGSAINRSEAALYGAAAFYSGGFPASAYLSIRRMHVVPEVGPTRACFDLLARPAAPISEDVIGLLAALREDDRQFVVDVAARVQAQASVAFAAGPDEWVPARLYEQLMRRFTTVNLRAVLPARPPGFWNELVESLIARTPSTWEFFPSQIQAIQGNLLADGVSFALQMPTGAGKTTLCETLLFDHLQRHPTEAAVLLVPYRSLASELRNSLVRRLNGMGISSRCAYGGTVPSGDEVQELNATRLLVATPEALSGLLSADQEFLRRVSLVICDEGHLLGAPSRGIGLELLLARLKGRETGAPRFVFISAIVPNVEEINAWLGGTADSIIRSEYRPALAEFGVLRERTGDNSTVNLEVHPHLQVTERFTVEGFLSRSDFQYLNPSSNRTRTLPYTSIKRRAVAAARKALPMGTAVVFAANKRGDQGAIGIAEELLSQLTYSLTLPQPLTFSNAARLNIAVDYLRREFGGQWIGTQALSVGAVLHHGDIPQETREVLEELLRRVHVSFAICTSTLAEGVNLPIRTLILYSVQRRMSNGRPDMLLSRDIKNLVGRAGRAGATTKGLVICANPGQWAAVERVALELPGENLVSSLRLLLDQVQRVLAAQNIVLTNEELEDSPDLYTLIDGIDSALIDLASEEITEERLVQLAVELADQTFAAQTAGPPSREVLRTVFRLRASRVAGIRTAGRLGWIRETGARMRMIETVETFLLNTYAEWETLQNPLDEQFVTAVLQWAWTHGKLDDDIRKVFRLEAADDLKGVRNSFFVIVRRWLLGDTYAEIAAASGSDVDDALGIYTGAISYGLQTVVEQGISLMSKLLEAQGRVLSEAVRAFPDQLRFGVPTSGAVMLSKAGIRHRRAAILLGVTAEISGAIGAGRAIVLGIVRLLLQTNEAAWRDALGELMYENTMTDVM
ncbi:MAG: DEAD/DEAH box helicase [Candidatus Sulfotelmatobacter sp.]